MSKRVPLVAAAIVMVTAGFSQTPQSMGALTVPELVKRTSNAVVQIVTSDETGEQKLGSGFVVSQDGKIVTNFHVIEGANSAIVKLTNGSSLPVKGILAQDADKDLVILKVNGRNFESLNLDSKLSLQVGDHVVAIGSPLGLEGTVSDGIVSAIRVDEEDKTWIQTTAPVSHGNSGGPLLNMRGKVVGVITRGLNPGEGQNLNFAIPALEVARLLSSNSPTSPLGNDCTSIAKTVDNVVERPAYLREAPLKEQLKWNERLEKAKQGDADSQFWVSTTYWVAASELSHNTAWPDETRAAYWECRTAVQGDAGAQFRLGHDFQNGAGVVTDHLKGEDWIVASAKQGLGVAQLELGISNMKVNWAEAYFWLTLGLADPKAVSPYGLESLSPQEDIDSLFVKWDEAAAHLSQAQLEQVLERARKWSTEEHSPKSLITAHWNN